MSFFPLKDLFSSQGSLLIGDSNSNPSELDAANASSGQVPQYDGTTTGWASVGGAWSKISKTTVSSAVSSVDITNIGTAGDYYVIKMFNVQPDTDLANFALRVSQDGGSTFDSGGNYDLGMATVGGGTTNHQNINSASEYRLTGEGVGSAATENLAATIELFRPAQSSVHQMIRTYASYMDDFGNGQFALTGGDWETAASVDAVRLFFESGNIAAGSFSLYSITG